MRVARFLGFAGLLLLAGCGQFFPKETPVPPVPPGTTGDYLYVANGSLSLNTIAGFSLSNSTPGPDLGLALSGGPYAWRSGHHAE